MGRPLPLLNPSTPHIDDGVRASVRHEFGRSGGSLRPIRRNVQTVRHLWQLGNVGDSSAPDAPPINAPVCIIANSLGEGCPCQAPRSEVPLPSRRDGCSYRGPSPTAGTRLWRRQFAVPSTHAPSTALPSPAARCGVHDGQAHSGSRKPLRTTLAILFLAVIYAGYTH